MWIKTPNGNAINANTVKCIELRGFWEGVPSVFADGVMIAAFETKEEAKAYIAELVEMFNEEDKKNG